MPQYHFAIPEALILDPTVTHLELRLYAYLVLRSDRDGRCVTTLKGMASELTASRSHLRAAAHRLRARGLLRWHRLGWRQYDSEFNLVRAA